MIVVPFGATIRGRALEEAHLSTLDLLGRGRDAGIVVVPLFTASPETAADNGGGRSGLDFLCGGSYADVFSFWLRWYSLFLFRNARSWGTA